MILTAYSMSVANLVITVFPEYNWLPWKFSRTPRNFWIDVNNQIKYIEWLGKLKNINKKEDWYEIIGKVKNKNIFKLKF
jgi:hypothetical protein